jgi:hypothetical protein
VEVWRVGDDGLTLRFTDAIESALKASQNFTLSDGKKEGTLLVTIPTNLRWKRIAGRTRALYAVEFSTLEGLRFDGSTGSCWDNELHKCASQIVRDAKITAGKIRKAGRER